MNTIPAKVAFCLIRGLNDTVAAFVVNGKVCSCISLPAPYADVTDEVKEISDVANSVAAAIGVRLSVVDLPRMHNFQRWTDIGMSYDQVKKYITEGAAAQNVSNDSSSQPKEQAMSIFEEELPPYLHDHT